MSTKVTQEQVKLTLASQNYSFRKYKLLELIDSQPVYLAKNLQKNLPKALGISRQHWAHYLNASLESKLEIPGSKLLILAFMFHVEPFQLFNVLPKFLPLESFYPETFSAAKEITKLTK